MDILFNNPLAWVQHQMLGGWRRSFVIGAIYLCLGLGILFFLARVLPPPPQGPSAKQFTGAALLILLAIEGMMLIFAGSGWVRRSVLRDFTSGMIDSHRLTPMSGWTAVVGYLIGPNLTFLPLTLVNIFFALGMSVWGGYPWWAWPTGLCVVACEAMTIAALSLVMSLSTRGSANVIGLVVMAAVMGGGFVLFLVPGLGMLIGVFAGATMIRASAGAITLDRALLLPVAGQIALGLICMKAASRKYLRADVQAFSWPLGMLLLGFVMLYGGLGLRVWHEHYGPTMGRFPMARMAPASQWIATLTAVTFFAILPLCGVIQARAIWDRQRLYYPEGAGRKPRHVAWVLLLVIVIAVAATRVTIGTEYFTMLLARSGAVWSDLRTPLGLSLLVFVLALLPIIGVLQVGYRVRERVSWFVIIWIVLAWAAPAAVDLLRAAYSEDQGEVPGLSWLMGCSPPGAWALIWLKPDVSVLPGIVVQAVLAVGVGLLLPLWKRKSPPVIATAAARPIIESAAAPPPGSNPKASNPPGSN